MCGIAGIIDLVGKWNRAALAEIATRMADAMPYRGPDDSGVWLSPDGRCALSHRRLSIIDTSAGGHQPLVLADGRHAVTFNGEIYNYQELRRELETAGQRFRTRSDTEVLLTLLAENGEHAIERLDGQFAFGHWHTEARELLLARDPFGEKPLYWSRGDGWFAFASELHALTRVPGFDDRIDADTIAEYLMLQYVDAPRSIYRSAQKLRPGHWLRLDGDGRVQLGRHFAWRPNGGVRPSRPIGELADELEEILLRLVRRRMIADVPLGAFLSGGVDSSTVVALMTKALGGRVKTFSIGFHNAPDESEHLFARQVAAHLGTEHHDRLLELDVLPLLHHIGTVLDEPNGDSSCLPTFLVSKVAREHVTVCLSGDGGDEMFGGYGRYFMTLQEEARGITNFDAGRRYYSSLMLIYCDDDLADLFGKVPARTEALLASLRRRLRRESGPLLHRMRRHDAEHYMPGDVLAKVDRMSMQHSLEVRTPFLSRELAAFCERLAVDDCFRDGALGGPQGKLVLKEVAQRYIPRQWLDRRKMGFGVPTKAGWGKQQMVSWLHELTLGNDSKLSQWIGRRGREAFVQRMESPHGFSFYQAWLMLVMETWLRAHPSSRGDDATTPPLERRTFDEVLSGDLRQEDLLLLRHLRAEPQPAAVFCSEELPPWIRQLPAGSVLVTPEAVWAPANMQNIALAWNGRAAPDVASMAMLPPGLAVFATSLREAHGDLLGFLQERQQTIVHRVGDRWHVQPAAAVAANGTQRTAASAPRLGERLFGHRVPSRPDRIERAGGFAWKIALPKLARARAQDCEARIVMFEDGALLPHGDSSPMAIARYGRGRSGLEREWLWFAASDNSDPTANGRRYLVALRGSHRNGMLHLLGASPIGQLAMAARDGLGRFFDKGHRNHVYQFRRPFRHDGGPCWRASLRSMRVPLPLLQQGWRAVVYEDGRELPMPDCPHEEVRRLGGGRHALWEGHVWFSATDDTNPNTNGRVYSIALVPPGPKPSSANGHDGTALSPAIDTDEAFDLRLAELAREPSVREPDLGRGGKVVMVIGTLMAGGTERQLCNLAVELDRRGLQVTILVLCGPEAAAGPYRSMLRGTGVRVRAANQVEPCIAVGGLTTDERRLQLLAALPAGPREEIWRLFSHIATLQPDVLHCCLDGPNISGGIAGVLADVPRIALGVRSLSPPNFPQHFRPWYKAYYRLLSESPRTRLFANSPEAAADYAQWSELRAERFRVIPNGIDGAVIAMPPAATVAAFKQSLGIPAEAPLIAGLLRLTEEKQPLLFVRAIAAARKDAEGLHAVLAGTGLLEREVKAEITRLGLGGRLHLLGTRGDVPTILAAADLVMLTSRTEGCPNALLEAQWLGRPVVATKVGGCVSAVLDGETGFLCEQTPRALAAACGALLSDPELRARMGSRAAQFARERFSLAAMVDQTLALYRENRCGENLHGEKPASNLP